MRFFTETDLPDRAGKATACLTAGPNQPEHKKSDTPIKVQPRPQNKQKTSSAYSPLLVAGATTLAASIFTKTVGFLTTGVVVLFGTLAVSVTFLFYARHIIRGLRTLRIQQKTMPIPYTFMQIDEIREARSRWWLSRFFKWVASWRKSPGG